MTEIDVKKLKHKNTDLVRKNGKLQKERDRLKNEIDELREKLDDAKLGLIWYPMLDQLGELIDENERLENKTYNLTLYLRDALNKLDRLNTAIHYDGTMINYTCARRFCTRRNGETGGTESEDHQTEF